MGCGDGEWAFGSDVMFLLRKHLTGTRERETTGRDVVDSDGLKTQSIPNQEKETGVSRDGRRDSEYYTLPIA